MKKFLFLFLFAATFIACSSDDDADTTGDDPIVGTWVLVNASEPFDALFCEDQQSTITFNDDNTGQGSFYLTENACEVDNSEGNWQNNGNSSYTINLPGVGDLNGNATFTGDDQFTFASQVGATLSFERL